MTSIAIVENSDGCVLSVRAQPGAKKTAVLGQHGGALKIAVNSPPVDGKANKALVEALHHFLGVKRSQVELVSGLSSRDKKFLIRGINKTALETRLAEIV